MKKTQIQLSDHFTYQKLLRFVLPSIVMMVFTSIYGVVDGLFVSNFVGKESFAALNLVYPLFMMLGALGYMFGTGGTALVAKTMGEGDDKRARGLFSLIVYATLIVGIACGVVVFVAVGSVASALGAEGSLLEECVVYGSILAFSLPFFMLQETFQSLLTAAGKPKVGLCVMVVAGVANIALDALFIIVFQWGLAGAALATAISEVLGGAIPFLYFARPNSSTLRLGRPLIDVRALGRVCVNGSSELVSNLSMSLVSMVYNFQLMAYIGPDGVAIYGVIQYVAWIAVSLLMGFTVGSSPIISYHYGARNHPELRNLLTKGLKVMGILGIVMTIAAISLSGTLANIFVGYDATLCELTRHAFHLFSFAFLLAGFNIFLSSFFTALNNGGVSAAISFLRTLVFQAASVILLPMALDVDGLWWAASAAEALAFVVSIGFLLALKGKYHYFDES